MEYMKNSVYKDQKGEIDLKEDYEAIRANDYLNQLKEKSKKIGTVLVRISPIMEILTGIMIAILIF